MTYVLAIDGQVYGPEKDLETTALAVAMLFEEGHRDVVLYKRADRDEVQEVVDRAKAIMAKDS